MFLDVVYDGVGDDVLNTFIPCQCSPTAPDDKINIRERERERERERVGECGRKRG